MTYTSASSTINKFKHIFAPHGLPEQIVSENGPQFTAKEFKDYCSSHGILYKITAPYHPGLNGKVERLVKTFKNRCSESKSYFKNSSVTDFLARYKATVRVRIKFT